MLYLLWSLVNLAALVWFLFICFSVLKLIRDEMGLAAVALFVVCILSFISSSVKNNKTDLPFGKLAGKEKVENFSIKDDLFYHIDLIYVIPDSAGKEIKSTTAKSGIVIGHDWKPVFSKANIKNGHVHYQGLGIHEWKFLGLTLYKQEIEIEGIK